MMTLDDPRWGQLEGGYRIPYNPTAALRRLEAGADQREVWAEFWNELHHQGDVGSASYATVPQLVALQRLTRKLDWNLYGLASTIEVERHRKSNPPIPNWLLSDYEMAWRTLVELAREELKAEVDKTTLQCVLAVLALGKGDLKLGAFLSDLDRSELDELLDNQLSWRELYRGGAV
jgi:hypothetical protein